MQELKELSSEAKILISKSDTTAGLEAARVELLGKKSRISAILSSISSLSMEDRKLVGAAANVLRQEVEQQILERAQQLLVNQDDRLTHIDLSEPGGLYVHESGHMHPTQVILSDIYDIFLRLGFAVADGPEIETDWYNFEVLNMPADHPAREMQDTFYVVGDGKHAPLVPRTHTSASQIRYMEQNQPPFKVIVPGRVYRNEDEDRTHIWSFYQVEGLVVGEGVSMADLKGTLLHIMKELFGPDTKVRFRPSYFPYTEPSVEIDVWYRDEWLELCGGGMVHPEVLRQGGIDPEQYSGFAFGFGADRLSFIRYGLQDIRVLWRPNLLIGKQV
ncbi:phenylalanine--tRNA ligase subunit alpha [Patescibacteria group bacterium]|nr:MAG: phenylalanine--tRNA ligase subunit alpha [Patescibacteria group bacterium]